MNKKSIMKPFTLFMFITNKTLNLTEPYDRKKKRPFTYIKQDMHLKRNKICL